MLSASLVSIQVGCPVAHGDPEAGDPHDQPWTTGFFKSPVQGQAFVGFTNIRGDGQADLVNHGGEDKAILAYSAEHYPLWRAELNLPAMGPGAFGENLTITGLSEESVCIGDRFKIGDVVLQVSQPRQPCWKLARRWRMHELPAMVVHNGRSGWYLRVVRQGWIEAAMPVTLMQRTNPDWTITRANFIMNHRRRDLAATRSLANVPSLSAEWVTELREREMQLRQISAGS